jgi:hypothetical protein
MSMLGLLVVGRYGAQSGQHDAVAAPAQPGFMRRVLALFRRR